MDRRINGFCIYLFGQQVKGHARFVVLNARHGNFAVRPRVFVHDGYVVVNDRTDFDVFRNAKRVRSSQELWRIVVNVRNGYDPAQRHRIRVGIFNRLV